MNEKMKDGSFFQRCYNYACSMAKLVGIIPGMPHLASRQMHRENAEADTPEDYYRRNVCLPSLDRLILGTDSHFDKYGKTVLLMMGLVPAVVADKGRCMQMTFHLLLLLKRNSCAGNKDRKLQRNTQTKFHCTASERMRQ